MSCFGSDEIERNDTCGVSPPRRGHAGETGNEAAEVPEEPSAKPNFPPGRRIRGLA